MSEQETPELSGTNKKEGEGKKPRGRPTGKRRTNQVHVLLTDEECEWLEEDRGSMDRNTYIRWKVFENRKSRKKKGG